MRDINRIKRIVDLIYKIWINNPDLRLGQLLYNYGGFTDHNYNLEDDNLEIELMFNLEKLKNEHTIPIGKYNGTFNL